MSESLYGPSPAFLRAVRWFSRGLYLFMGIAVIAAFAYANGESNENEKLRRDKRDLEGRVAALEQGLDGLQYSRASGGSDGAALHRQIETLNGELAAKDQEIADLNQRLIDERMRADTAGIEAQHSLSRLDELERKIRLLTEERDVLLRAGATQPKPAEGAQPAAPEKLDAAFQRLHENEKDTAVRLSVIDAMRGVDDDTCVVAIRKNAKTLLPETILMLIEGRRPVGGDELATELFRLPGGEQLAGEILGALSGYSTETANELRLTIADTAAVDIATRVRALGERAVAGEKRAADLVRLLYKDLKPGDPLRLILIKLPGACGDASFAAAAEAALIDAQSTGEEQAAAKASFRALGNSGYERLRSLYDAREALGLEENQTAPVQALMLELKEQTGK